jgi:hypothetical protein
VIKKEEDENQERNDIAKLNWERVVILDKFVTYERETGPVSSKTFPHTHTHISSYPSRLSRGLSLAGGLA